MNASATLRPEPPFETMYHHFLHAVSVTSFMNSSLKTCRLCGFLAILVMAAHPAPAQSRTESALVFNLRSYGWEPPDRLDHSGPLIVVDHQGRVLVGFTLRKRSGLATRTQPSLDFRIIRFASDGKADLSLSLPTSVKGITGIYLSDTDQIIARANENLQLLQADEGSPCGGTWKIIAPCVRCSVTQSFTRRTLALDTPATDSPATLVHLSQQPLVKECGRVPGSVSITDEFAYRSLDGDTYRWPLCDYAHRVELPLHTYRGLIALNDRLFVLKTFDGKDGLEVTSSDGQLKFRPKLADHEWALSYPAIRGSERGDRIAVDVVTMRGGIAPLDIGSHPTARRITVYDVGAGRELASIAAHVKYPYGFEFALSPDGHRLAILEDDTVRFLDLDGAAH